MTDCGCCEALSIASCVQSLLRRGHEATVTAAGLMLQARGTVRFKLANTEYCEN